MLKNGDDESQQHVEIAAEKNNRHASIQWMKKRVQVKNGHAESSMLKLMQKKTWKACWINKQRVEKK